MTAEERAALQQHFAAIETLKSLGWRTMDTAPTDGTTILLVEPHSTGIFRGRMLDAGAAGGAWFAEDTGDLWPSDPMLWKPVESVSVAGTSNIGE